MEPQHTNHLKMTLQKMDCLHHLWSSSILKDMSRQCHWTLERDETSSLTGESFNPDLHCLVSLELLCYQLPSAKSMVNGNIPCGVHPLITSVIRSGGSVLNSSSSSSEVYSNSKDTSSLPLPEAITSLLHQQTFRDRSSSTSTAWLSVHSPSLTFPSRMWIFHPLWHKILPTSSDALGTLTSGPSLLCFQTSFSFVHG